MKITLDRISKQYSKRAVVDTVSLGLEQGEVVGLLGPNGAGKTTTFYMITGLEKPDSGRICLDRRDITTTPMHLRARMGIGYLPQQQSIFRHLSVEQNILLVLEQTGVPRRYWRKKLEELLEEFGIATIRRSKGIQVSGGESRRVEIARALAVGLEGPQFLLLDEPFAGIDPIAVSDIQRMITRLRDRGIGILITDHNVRATLTTTDRAYIMNQGKVFASGTPDELAGDPLVRQYYLGDEFQL
ncbi:LPS export ABC transporter ATP-binding protein [Gloeobacter kilaueensis]|uniref:ABC transporter, ATP-binding protein n=1 Tax=Gloeobacter kilaueensis (strain ATCC BAA-2537 / CCAP 1431/1 / ULC 316 / JS1) TaxID=1183438 RepID=U5QM82_GLOK1|nr:LPS export ABC transporter ATP-binding protein [Gloeobacter kilaueensis]AGY60097.1 ABC transporter, ATP-binding protein [Gloeobacter kilaueensis JS1]